MIKVRSSLTGYMQADFDRRRIRKWLRETGARVRNDARALISGRDGSAANAYPGRQTGAMMRAVKLRLGRDGLSMSVGPFRNAELMRNRAYYPAFLIYGTNKIDPRKNFMTAAAEKHAGAFERGAQDILRDALKPALLKLG